ncbi:MAG: hypothetical protein JNK05_09925 [Myxococcales bacterium]|nr:hypothetical protein [Myxococcales bacterium]
MNATLSTLRSLTLALALARCSYGSHSASASDPSAPALRTTDGTRPFERTDAASNAIDPREDASPDPLADATATPAPDAATFTEAPRPRSLDERLADDAIDNERPWREVLYSWTPPDRAAAIAQSRVLLAATAQSGNAPSPFSRLLTRLRSREGELGLVARALLEDPALNRYRYAWSNAYATALGFIGRSYGTALVRIELAPNALVLRLDPRDVRPLRLYDREQREVPLRRFDELRGRIAAVYHVRRSGDVRVPFREYVVCNASAVARWSLATPPVREEIARERELVSALYDALAARSTPSLSPRERYAEWNASTRSSAPTLAHRWARAMATAAPHYDLSLVNLRALAAALALYDTNTVTEQSSTQ